MNQETKITASTSENRNCGGPDNANSNCEMLDNVNIYELDAQQALFHFERYVDGSVNDVLLVLSSSTLDDVSRAAIESTAEKLGYGKSRISWASILDRIEEDRSVAMSPENLRLLTEAIDPVGIIVTDIGAMCLLSEAYGVGMEADSANRVACRTIAAFNDFNTMLDDDDSKQKAWRILKNLSLDI